MYLLCRVWLVNPATSTRDRIVVAATGLFAAQGIRATTVAQIEAAVGLRPGSGGLHRHFATKDDLVRAVLDHQLARAGRDVAEAETLPPPKPGQALEYLQALGDLIVAGANEHRDVALIMLRDAHNLPEGALDAQHRRNFDATYRTIADGLQAYGGIIRDSLMMDVDALAFLFVAPLIYHRIVEWATGTPVLDLDTDKLVDTWARVYEPIFEQLVATNQPEPTTNKPPKPSAPASARKRRQPRP
jgi:AcrR family transcriptional regulator